MHRTYLSSNIKGRDSSNTQQYENAGVDDIPNQAGRESDPAKRKALYAKFQHVVAKELPVYWSYTRPYHTIYSSKVGNFRLRHLGHLLAAGPTLLEVTVPGGPSK